ncbi:MAG TPA: ATP-binding protein [Bacteroidia bacterium]|nr:ATP-binding protein [Bacteroidia bacterium]
MKIGNYKISCGSSICRYALFGIAFGFCFPVLAILFDTLVHLHLPLTMESVRYVHSVNPLHYIIDSAPLFLGIAFGVAGYYQYSAESYNRSLQRQATVLENANQTLRKTLEDFHNAQSLLVKSEKLASLGQLTAGIAHELRNPLNFITNFSESSNELLDELASIQDEKERLEVIEILKGNFSKIHLHGSRANSILQSMMLHARSEKAERRLSDINEISRDAADIAFHGMSSGIIGFTCSFQKDLAKDLPKIFVVYEDISRVVLNLLTNAFYAVNERRKKENDQYQAKVYLGTRCQSSGETDEDKWIQIIVRDNGTGIPQHIKDKIFNPFFTTKPSGEGTGLGLSISHDIVLVHGGTMTVESAENNFTEFYVTLPVNDKSVSGLDSLKKKTEVPED